MKITKFLSISISILAGLLLLTVISCGLLLRSYGNSLCASETLQEVHSPDGEEKVVVFQRDCGATTGFRTHISLVRSDTTLGNRTGNIFQADGHPDTFAIEVTWNDDTHILIEHNGKPIPDMARTSVHDKEIQYIENREGILPPRPFQPSELLLPVDFFPQGWRSEELRPIGPEIVRGSKENNPYMLYKPPVPSQYPEARHAVRRLDNVGQAATYFQNELEVFEDRYSLGCAPTGTTQLSESAYRSEYTENLAIGFTEHQYGSSGRPRCMMIAQYDEFYIQFEATVSDSGLTYDRFNELVEIIDEIMVQHLRQ